MFRKIRDIWHDFKNGIKSLIIWFPAIWKDRQWDHMYIYQILRKKLHLTEQLIRNHGIHVNNLRDADKIKVCVNLLDRLIIDDYTAYKRHDEKWGESTFNFVDLNDSSRRSQLLIEYPNVITPKDKEQEVKDFRRASTHEVMLRDQDLDLLFKLMRKHIQSWWD
jgi:hypothetical protein